MKTLLLVATVACLLFSATAVKAPVAEGFQEEVCTGTAVGGQETQATQPTEGGEAPPVVLGDIEGGAPNQQTVVLAAEQCRTEGTTPQASSDVGYSGGSAPGPEGEDVSVAAPVGDECVESQTDERSTPEGGVISSTFCVKWRVCGGERVDDIVSGEIAGEVSTGQYRSYLDLIVGYVAAAIDLGPAATDSTDALTEDPASVNDFLLDQGLGERPSGEDLIPIFNWCAEYGEVAGERVYDPVDLASVSFGWDLTYDEVYDIPGATNQLYTRLQARLDLYNPEIGLVPKTELGFTYVQWPTWMYLQNPSEDIMNFTTNSTDTLRIDLRAKLEGVDWSFGDEVIKTCTAAEMVPFTDQLDPIEDVPDCHHMFTRADCQNLTATTRFKIEQMVRTRPSATSHEYPTASWEDFLGTPTEVELSSTIDDYEVTEIVSVNVPQGMTVDDVIAAGRAAGTIPQPGERCNFLATQNE